MTRRPSLLSRREVLKTAAGAAGAVIFAPMINLGRYRLFADSPQEYSARAIRLVERSLVIDMLGLFTLDGERQSRWHRDPETFSADDLREIRESGITVFHPAVGLGGPTPTATPSASSPSGTASSPGTMRRSCGSTAPATWSG